MYCSITALCSMYDYNVINCLVIRKVIWRQSLARHHHYQLSGKYFGQLSLMSNKPYELVHNQNQYVYVPTCTQSFNSSSLDCLFVIIQLHTYLPKNITLLRVYIRAKKPREIIKKILIIMVYVSCFSNLLTEQRADMSWFSHLSTSYNYQKNKPMQK